MEKSTKAELTALYTFHCRWLHSVTSSPSLYAFSSFQHFRREGKWKNGKCTGREADSTFQLMDGQKDEARRLHDLASRRPLATQPRAQPFLVSLCRMLKFEAISFLLCPSFFFPVPFRFWWFPRDRYQESNFPLKSTSAQPSSISPKRGSGGQMDWPRRWSKPDLKAEATSKDSLFQKKRNRVLYNLSKKFKYKTKYQNDLQTAALGLSQGFSKKLSCKFDRLQCYNWSAAKQEKYIARGTFMTDLVPLSVEWSEVQNILPGATMKYWAGGFSTSQMCLVIPGSEN